MWYCKKISRECLYYEKCNSSVIEMKKKDYFTQIFEIFFRNNRFKNTFKNYNIENALLEIWIKKIRKIEQLNIKDLPSYINKYKNKYKYWSYTFNDTKYKKSWNKVKWTKPKNKKFILILSNNEENIKLYTKLDNSFEDKYRVIATWLLLWYPKCCVVAEFDKCKNVEHIKNINYDWDDAIFSDGVECKLLNPYIRIYAHMWCSNKCINTIEQCEKVLNYYENKYGEEIVNYFFNMVNKKEKYKL